MIKILSSSHDDYPALLGHIAQPPGQLFVRGNIQVLSAFSIAIVGSRKPSPYGVRATEEIASGVAECGAVIVSGCAYGIDRIAHEEALRTGIPTVAVLGGGIDDASVYPASHLGLVRRIIQDGGAVVSEFPPGTQPRPGYFPQRNRIIAGLTKGVVVIEAGYKSGALSTAKHALEANRDVFAVPGSIFSPLSAGTNKLLDSGAFFARSGQEVVKEVSCGYAFVQSGRAPEDILLVKRLLKHGPQSLQTLGEQARIPLPDLLKLLTQLELDGQISRLSGQIYVLHE